MFSLNCKGRLLVVDKPLVMGILNSTPDSFYAESRVNSISAITDLAGRMLEEGAAILDIGGQSTRPGSIRVDEATEAERVIPAIQALHRHFPDALLSVDTFYASVAAGAIEAGASVVNDISGGLLDPAMLETVARYNVPYVLMHMPGTPQTMQQYTGYKDLIAEVLDYFIQRRAAASAAGIHDIILDPGFGFGKTAAQNFQLLNRLRVFTALQAPVLLGISRKSFIWKTLDVDPASEACLHGTTALHMTGLLQGASFLRVHDVKEAVHAVTLYTALTAQA